MCCIPVKLCPHSSKFFGNYLLFYDYIRSLWVHMFDYDFLFLCVSLGSHFVYLSQIGSICVHTCISLAHYLSPCPTLTYIQRASSLSVFRSSSELLSRIPHIILVFPYRLLDLRRHAPAYFEMFLSFYRYLV